jgi:hypothetical protein
LCRTLLLLLLLLLQDRNTQLHEEVRWHEAQQLNSTDFAIRDGKARRRPTCSSQ